MYLPQAFTIPSLRLFTIAASEVIHMARGFLAAILAVVLFGAVAGIAYQAGLAAAGAGAAAVAPAAGAYPYYWHPFFGFFGFLFPLFFIFLLFGLGRALFWGGHRGHWGGYDERRRMIEQMHKEMHERPASGTGTTDR